jgi:hypothetical protein
MRLPRIDAPGADGAGSSKKSKKKHKKKITKRARTDHGTLGAARNGENA